MSYLLFQRRIAVSASNKNEKIISFAMGLVVMTMLMLYEDFFSRPSRYPVPRTLSELITLAVIVWVFTGILLAFIRLFEIVLDKFLNAILKKISPSSGMIASTLFGNRGFYAFLGSSFAAFCLVFFNSDGFLILLEMLAFCFWVRCLAAKKSAAPNKDEINSP